MSYKSINMFHIKEHLFMKNIYYLLAIMAIVLVTIIACEKLPLEVDELQSVQEEELSRKTPKVRLCHWDPTSGGYITRAISQKAAQAHIKHGDKYLYSPKEEWAIIKTTSRNSSVRLWDVNVDTFDGTNFSGQGTYQLEGPPGIFTTTFLRVWGTVDNSSGDMDIELIWSSTHGGGGAYFNFGGTSCMCSGIYEVHEYAGDTESFELDQPLFPPCQIYPIP